jgi:hypothetical protein
VAFGNHAMSSPNPNPLDMAGGAIGAIGGWGLPLFAAVGAGFFRAMDIAPKIPVHLAGSERGGCALLAIAGVAGLVAAQQATQHNIGSS